MIDWRTEAEKFGKLFVVENISKQIQDEQYEVIYNLCQKAAVPNMSAVEIGCWTGCASSIIAECVSRVNGILFCVDWFKGIPNHQLEEVASRNNIQALHRQNVTEVGYYKWVNVLPMSSEEAVKTFQDNSIDFLFIDGDHKYEKVKQDINLWYPKVKKGGWLTGHDCEIHLLPHINIDHYLTLGDDSLYIEEVQTWAHVGVVKAVGERFHEVNITNGIWSVKK